MEMKLFVSTGKEKRIRTSQVMKWEEDNGVENKVINLYPSIKYQTWEGFGGAVTDAAGYVFSQMNDQQKEHMLSTYFDEQNMNYQIVRIPMDSCDFSTHIYSAVVDSRDSELQTFSFQDTERYIIPLLDAAEKQGGKKLKIMLSAWSPPAFMKTNDSRLNGGSLKPEYRKIWAEYLCKYIEAFRNRGYQVARISIQNEPKAVQTWDSCIYTAKEEKEFLRDFLYPALINHGLEDIEVFIWDHNKERLFERAEAIIDAETNAMIAGMAFHWYSGDHFEALDLVKEQFPDKKLILSESCLEYYKFDSSMEITNAVRLAHDMIGNLNHGMHAFYDWNILLNKQGGPNHVNNYCDAPYLYDEETEELIPRMTLHYYWHFTHFIRPGAVRIAHTRYTEQLDVTAWENKDGRIAVILLNTTEKPLSCVLRMNGKMMEIELAANSIASGFVGGKK